MNASPDSSQRDIRPLVCFIGTLRALERTSQNLDRRLVKHLNADVAICVSRTSDLDDEAMRTLPDWQIIDKCLYNDTNEGYENLCDLISKGIQPSAAAPYPWRKALAISGNWLGGLPGIAGSGMHLNYNLYKLSERLKSPFIQEKNYTHYIITRTDFQWLAPHPPLHLMNKRLVWIPEGEDYKGYNDRHAVCSEKNIFRYLNFLETLISGEAYGYLMPYKSLNHEYQLKLHLIHQGVRVGRFMNLAYLTGSENTPTNCAELKAKEIDGKIYSCKYPGEVDSAVANSQALAGGKDYATFIKQPPRIQSYLPIWKAKLRKVARSSISLGRP